MIRRALPVLVFAATLALFERLAAGRWSLLPVWTLAAFGATSLFVWLFPWRRAAERVGPDSRTLLFLLMVRHFAFVLEREAGRAFLARSLAVPNRYGPGWFRSLAHAAASVLWRAVLRAERFYAGLFVRGFAE